MQYKKLKIAERIKSERKKAKLSIEEMAERLDVNRNTITTWERQDEKGRIPPLEAILRMCELFQCELGYLLCEYDCKTRAATDIQAETGLNEGAIRVLKGLKNSIQMITINLLFEPMDSKHNYAVLDAIHQYLHFIISTDTVVVNEWGDEKLGGRRLIPSKAIEGTLFSEVAHSLSELKEFVRSNKSYAKFKQLDIM